jgi:hypothetical protein
MFNKLRVPYYRIPGLGDHLYLPNSESLADTINLFKYIKYLKDYKFEKKCKINFIIGGGINEKQIFNYNDIYEYTTEPTIKINILVDKYSQSASKFASHDFIPSTDDIGTYYMNVDHNIIYYKVFKTFIPDTNPEFYIKLQHYQHTEDDYRFVDEFKELYKEFVESCYIRGVEINIYNYAVYLNYKCRKSTSEYLKVFNYNINLGASFECMDYLLIGLLPKYRKMYNIYTWALPNSNPNVLYKINHSYDLMNIRQPIVQQL